MSPEHVWLVREGWKGIVPVRDTFAQLFYAKLFELDPSLRPMFKGDLREQGRSFVAMISIALRNLDHPEKIAQALRELGRRHERYGAKRQHYETVQTAFILSLALSLGDGFTAEARAAWERAYAFLVDAMDPRFRGGDDAVVPAKAGTRL